MPRRRQTSANQSQVACNTGQEDPDHHHQYGRRKLTKQELIHIEEELQDYYELNKHLILEKPNEKNIKL